jgi:uncharacterized protein YgiM (DUF1202 family)
MNRMLKFLPIAAIVAGLAVAGGPAPAQVGSNVGDSMNQPMVVIVDNGNVRERPNATAKILTTAHRGRVVTMIGTASGWAHVKIGNLDGYMDMVQLSKPSQ